MTMAPLAMAPLAITSGSAEDAATIERLNARIASLETDRKFFSDRLVQNRAEHRADIARIGERLIEEATDRDWCYEDDEIIDELNRHLTVELPGREREYTVTVNVQVEFRVDARDEDGARSAAYDIARRMERDLDSNDGVVSNWDSDDSWEVTEA